jgi:hypothetical protein
MKIGKEQTISGHDLINLNKKSNNKQMFANHDAKVLMQTNYKFDDRNREIMGTNELG